MKDIVRGVGSGLPIVKDSMRSVGGHILIEDNLKNGCVITLSCSTERAKPKPVEEEQPAMENIVSSQPSTVEHASEIVSKSKTGEKHESTEQKSLKTNFYQETHPHGFRTAAESFHDSCGRR